MNTQAPKSKARKRKSKVDVNTRWEQVNPHAAGIDIGARESYACVPADRDPKPVQRFGTTTPEIQRLSQWLQQCGVTTVAMEATGIYWIGTFQILERNGFKVYLVNPRQVKNVSGRKSDVQDCQWIQKLHTFGLLGASFRPADPYCVARSYLRLREDLVGSRSGQILRMQKALHQMNVQLSHVLSDITGESGLKILEAILAGERDPVQLAKLANPSVHASRAKIAAALTGDYRCEHLFALRTAYELYQTYQEKIERCDLALVAQIEQLPDRIDLKDKPLPPRPDKKKRVDETLRAGLYRTLGADLTAIEGVGAVVALTLLTEVGPDLSAFRSEKHFCSWLGLCPDNRISGGKILSVRTRRVVNRLSDALRTAASTLQKSQSALGAFHRRMKAKLGAAEAITATAHKLARLIYRLLKHGEEYVRVGLEQYELKYRQQKEKTVRKLAASLGLQFLEPQPVTQIVS